MFWPTTGEEERTHVPILLHDGPQVLLDRLILEGGQRVQGIHGPTTPTEVLMHKL
jgi:hypothetical protein